jgi:hypothetical protein
MMAIFRLGLAAAMITALLITTMITAQAGLASLLRPEIRRILGSCLQQMFLAGAMAAWAVDEMVGLARRRQVTTWTMMVWVLVLAGAIGVMPMIRANILAAIAAVLV